MTNELKLREAAERVRDYAEWLNDDDSVLDSPYRGMPGNQWGIDRHRLECFAIETLLAAREGEEKLFKEAAWFCNEAIKSCDCTSTERIQYEETRDDFLGRLAKALGISTKENNT